MAHLEESLLTPLTPCEFKGLLPELGADHQNGFWANGPNGLFLKFALREVPGLALSVLQPLIFRRDPGSDRREFWLRLGQETIQLEDRESFFMAMYIFHTFRQGYATYFQLDNQGLPAPDNIDENFDLDSVRKRLTNHSEVSIKQSRQLIVRHIELGIEAAFIDRRVRENTFQLDNGTLLRLLGNRLTIGNDTVWLSRLQREIFRYLMDQQGRMEGVPLLSLAQFLKGSGTEDSYSSNLEQRLSVPISTLQGKHPALAKVIRVEDNYYLLDRTAQT